MHFPKTGGHTLAAAIRDAARGREDVMFDRIGDDDHRWHNSVGERVAVDHNFDPSGKVVISGARRLP